MLNNIKIVLVNTSHPGNIGSAARAMKTMGLTDLVLVSPKLFPHDKALEMASNAADVVHQATVVPDLETAIADCDLVVGTSTRSRSIPWPLLTPRSFAEKVKTHPTSSKIAVIFGREQSGLTNEELHKCHFHIQIPSNPDYSSLNLASAVQIIAYELQVMSLDDNLPPAEWDYPPANAAQMEGFYQHLEVVLTELDFLKSEAPRQLMTRLRRLFYRANPDVMEMNILRGFLKAIQTGPKKS
jgi:tRNA (cytidine32/uridine32-2'-O)-methyltransferase